MDGLYEISALLGFVENNKPQMNADRLMFCRSALRLFLELAL